MNVLRSHSWCYGFKILNPDIQTKHLPCTMSKKSCQKQREEDGEHALFAKALGYQDFTGFQRWC